METIRAIAILKKNPVHFWCYIISTLLLIGKYAVFEGIIKGEFDGIKTVICIMITCFYAVSSVFMISIKTESGSYTRGILISIIVGLAENYVLNGGVFNFYLLPEYILFVQLIFIGVFFTNLYENNNYSKDKTPKP